MRETRRPRLFPGGPAGAAGLADSAGRFFPAPEEEGFPLPKLPRATAGGGGRGLLCLGGPGGGGGRRAEPEEGGPGGGGGGFLDDGALGLGGGGGRTIVVAVDAMDVIFVACCSLACVRVLLFVASDILN